MANHGDRPKPKSWASGLRLVSRESTGTTQETPKSSNPSEEKEFRFLMGQSFMGGGLDGLMGESSNSRKREANDDQSQAEVDNMLSSILKKTKTDLKHVNPSLLDLEPEPPKNPTPININQNNPYYPNVNAYQPPPVNMAQPPPFIDVTRPPPFLDTSRPPPNFIHSPPNLNQTSCSSTPVIEETRPVSKTIERKWGNILKSSTPTSPTSNDDSSTSPIHETSTPTSTSGSPWAKDSTATSTDSKAGLSALAEVDAVEESSSQIGSSVSLEPTVNSKGFKDIMSYNVDPVDMTYCGKEFIDIVDVRRSHEAVCNLCQVNRLPVHELALHLESESHNKNLRNFILEKEYDFFSSKMGDPLHDAKFPDFKTYMLQRYPTRLEEYFEKCFVLDTATMKTRSEFQLKIKPTKMQLAETVKGMGNFKKNSEKFAPAKKLNECPYCGDMIAIDQIASHSCEAEKASEQASTRRLGVPTSFVRKELIGEKKTESKNAIQPMMPPTDAVDVQLKLEMCEEYKKFAQCQYGRKCMFAHDAEELNSLTYRRTKSELCEYVGQCLELCGKAHGTDELMVCAKTVLCRSYIEMSSCQYKDKCQFAHGVHELLSPWDSRPLYSAGPKETTQNKQLAPFSAQISKGESQKQSKSKIKLTLKK